jgi:pyruvate ferredoxin oxidoreductase delta subunit
MKEKAWRELAIGGIIPEGGNSHSYNVSGWRTFRPVFIPENCIHCLFCWIYCPDSAVIIKDGKMTGFDYDHCKGCGICAYECPAKKKAIEMKLEEEFAKEVCNL